MITFTALLTTFPMAVMAMIALFIVILFVQAVKIDGRNEKIRKLTNVNAGMKAKHERLRADWLEDLKKAAKPNKRLEAKNYDIKVEASRLYTVNAFLKKRIEDVTEALLMEGVDQQVTTTEEE